MAQNTKQKILLVTQDLILKNGYHGFSFQDIADQVGIQKPSLFEHYKNKENLVLSVVRSQCAQFKSWSSEQEHLSASTQISSFFEFIYRISKDKNKFCPLMSLGASYSSLPKRIQKEVHQLYLIEKKWLRGLIRQSGRGKSYLKKSNIDLISDLLFSTLMGMQLEARLNKNPENIRRTKVQFIKAFL